MKGKKKEKVSLQQRLIKLLRKFKIKIAAMIYLGESKSMMFICIHPEPNKKLSNINTLNLISKQSIIE